MAKLYGGLKSPKQSSLRAVGTVPPATSGGGGTWWETKLAEVSDPQWDNVVSLFQAHPDDVYEHGNAGVYAIPDRKDSGRTWGVARDASYTSAAAGNTRYAEMELNNRFPLGAGFYKNDYGCLYSDQVPDWDWEQDWTLEMITAKEGGGSAGTSVHHGSGHHWWCFPDPADGYYFAASGGHRWGANIAMYFSGSGSQTNRGNLNWDLASQYGLDPIGDYIAQWHPCGAGPVHLVWVYDHSASTMRMFSMGRQCRSNSTGMDMSTYNDSSSLGIGIHTSVSATSKAGAAGHGPTKGWVSSFRITLGDRYGVAAVASGGATSGDPAQFSPVGFFPEKGE